MGNFKNILKIINRWGSLISVGYLVFISNTYLHSLEVIPTIIYTQVVVVYISIFFYVILNVTNLKKSITKIYQILFGFFILIFLSGFENWLYVLINYGILFFQRISEHLEKEYLLFFINIVAFFLWIFLSF